MKQIAILVFAIVTTGLPLATSQAQGEAGGPKTILLADPDHPLAGTWQYANAAGTATCPGLTIPLPADGPVPVTITASDGGARLAINAPAGTINLRRVEVAQWDSEATGDMQVLRKTIRTDNAALMARAMAGDVTLYEGTLHPTTGMTVRYIMGWDHGDADILRGHIVSTFQPGCTAKRAFMATRGG